MSPADQFHVPDGIYLLSHSVGCMPLAAAQTLNETYLSAWREKGGDAWPAWLGLIDDFCGEAARLLGGRADDYCPQANLSSALVKYLGTLPGGGTRKKVVMHADAFPSLGFAVHALSPDGFDLHLIGAGQDAADPTVWQDALDGDTVAAVITHVHSNTGVMAPVRDIAALCRARGVAAIVDIAQSAGIVPVDVASWGADAVLGSCVKWLCGGPGAGFMWVSPDTVSTLRPRDVGWFSHEDPFEFDIKDFRYAPGAKRFWGGTPSIAPFACALGALRVLNAIGIPHIRAHNRALSAHVLDAVANRLPHGPDPDKTGGTLCLTFDRDTADRAADRLGARGCRFDRRGDTLRLSFHIYNTEEDALLIGDTLSRAVRQPE